MVNWIPLGGPLVHGNLRIDGVSEMPKGYGVDKLVTAPGYFGTMGIRLFAGRDFDSRDNESSLPVTIISRSVARQVWLPDGLGAIGQRLTENGENPQSSDWQTIIGIVDDVAQRGATDGRHGAQYFPLAQSAVIPFISNVTFVVHTARTSPDLTPSLRAVVHELSPVVALRNIQAMGDAAAASTADSRFETQLLTISRRSRCCLLRSEPTVCWRTTSPRGRTSLASASRSAQCRATWSESLCAGSWRSCFLDC
jgi:hypothetical protein